MFHFESCEGRRLFSVIVSSSVPGVAAKLSKTGVLTITGTTISQLRASSSRLAVFGVESILAVQNSNSTMVVWNQP